MQSHAEASVSTFAASIGRIKSLDPGRGSAGRAEVAFKHAAQLFKSNGFGENGDATLPPGATPAHLGGAMVEAGAYFGRGSVPGTAAGSPPAEAAS